LPNTRSEILALLFGVLLILLTFGDDHTGNTIGNLDTIFGLRFWPLMDIIYPLASILVFLYYGETKANGDLKINLKTTMLFLTYIVLLFLISVDDVLQVLGSSATLPRTYWIIIMWLYPIGSAIAFFAFGHENEIPENT